MKTFGVENEATSARISFCCPLLFRFNFREPKAANARTKTSPNFALNGFSLQNHFNHNLYN